MQDRDDLLFLIWFQYVIEGLYLISLEYKVRIGGNKNNLRCGSPFPYLPRLVATPSRSFISISRNIISNTESLSARTSDSPQSNSAILNVSPHSSSSVSNTFLKSLRSVRTHRRLPDSHRSVILSVLMYI